VVATVAGRGDGGGEFGRGGERGIAAL